MPKARIMLELDCELGAKECPVDCEHLLDMFPGDLAITPECLCWRDYDVSEKGGTTILKRNAENECLRCPQCLAAEETLAAEWRELEELREVAAEWARERAEDGCLWREEGGTAPFDECPAAWEFCNEDRAECWERILMGEARNRINARENPGGTD